MVFVWVKQINNAVNYLEAPTVQEVRAQPQFVRNTDVKIFSNKTGKLLKPAIPIETIVILDIPTIS